MSYRTFRNRAEMEAAGWTFPSDLRPTPCRDCSASVIWVRSPKGKNVPVNADDQHTVHFATCGNTPPPRPADQTGKGGHQPPAPTHNTAPLLHAIQENTAVLRELVAELKARRQRQ